jgi:hypothetical protein
MYIIASLTVDTIGSGHRQANHITRGRRRHTLGHAKKLLNCTPVFFFFHPHKRKGPNKCTRATAPTGTCECKTEALPRLLPSAVNVILRQAASGALLGHHGATFHGLRAGTIMINLAGGIPPALTAESSGHTRLDELKRYARLHQQIANAAWHPHDPAVYKAVSDAPKRSSWHHDIAITRSFHK